MLFEERVKYNKEAFMTKVKSISKALKIKPEWLMAVMDLETIHTFSPSITNSIGATGLIQFMPDTARELGTTTYALRQMSNVEQLDYVYKYLLRYKHNLKRFEDVYLSVLFPAAVGKSKNWVLRSKDISASSVARSNHLFDANGNGEITKKEVLNYLYENYPQIYRKKKTKNAIIIMLIALAVISLIVANNKYQFININELWN